jgi:hypothetical protein
VLKGSELEAQLQAWYREHAGAFATTAANGAKTIPPLASVKERALADFSVDLRDRLIAEKARELRKVRSVVVDEKVLGSL